MLSPEDLQSQLTAASQTLLASEQFSPREQALASLAIALSLEESTLAREAVLQAKQVDVSNQEINYLSALVLALRARKLSRLMPAGQPLPQVKVTSSDASCCQ